MRYCPNCGTRNKLSFLYCYKCGYKLKRDEIDEFRQKRKEIPKKFKINEFITLKLEKNKIFIYIKGEKFLQCKYLLIDIPIEKVKKFDDINSIDEAIERLDHSLEDPRLNSEIPIEIEFWGHASNLQAWAENDYDTRLLHHNFAFPLLKRLTDVGDKIAHRVFKEEIAKRLMSGYKVVRDYLIEENYLDYFNDDELDVLLEHFRKEIYTSYYEKYKHKIESIELEALINIICSNLKFNTQFITINEGLELSISLDIFKKISNKKKRLLLFLFVSPLFDFGFTFLIIGYIIFHSDSTELNQLIFDPLFIILSNIIMIY
ncbi:MAG: zinc-ribbon domain-containing protein [Promethearchaeota archaeon]